MGKFPDSEIGPEQAEQVIADLAKVFFEASSKATNNSDQPSCHERLSLPEVEVRYQTLIEQVPAVTFMISLDGGIGETYVSPHIETALGFSQKEWLDDPIRWYRQIHPDDKLRWNVEAARMIVWGEPLAATYRVFSRDQRVVWLQCEAKLVRAEDGRPWFIQGIAFDVTNLKHAEAELRRAHDELEKRVDARTRDLAANNEILKAEIEERKHAQEQFRVVAANLEKARQGAEASSRAKADFLAHMSHELRTPMNGVIGMTELALASQLDTTQREYIYQAHESAISLLGILNDILDLSKIEAGKLEFIHAAFELPAVLQAIASVMAVAARNKGIGFEIESKADVPENLLGDALRLRQVLLNLVSNAIKFTKVGQVTASVELVERLEDAKRVKLRFIVKDSGIGMSPEQERKLFQPFTQGDASITREFGGTGLGLAISKSLVEMMEGEIAVSSEAGKGSSFRFTAWFGISDQPVRKKPQARPPVDYNLEGLRVLVVEDNYVNQKVAAGMLKKVRIAVSFANDGAESVAILQNSGETFDAVLMDLQMPVMDGLTATRIIRKDTRFDRLPIIAMTANATENDRELCLNAGMQDFISKPFVASRLYDVLTEWVTDGGKKPSGG